MNHNESLHKTSIKWDSEIYGNTIEILINKAKS